MKKTNKLISILLAVAMLLSMAPIMVFAAENYAYPTAEPTATWTGGGTENDPYVITTAQQLADFAWFVNNKKTAYNAAYYKLGNDIDLSGSTWTPIGAYSASSANPSYPFAGVLDGAGKTVSGLNSVVANERNQAGLFGAVSGTVKNLTVSGAYTLDASSISGICGYLSGGTIENCTNKVSISATRSNAVYLGGVVGYVSGGVVKNCTNEAIMQYNGSGTANTGGVCGYVTFGEVLNCKNTAKIIGNSSGNEGTGGICGFAGGSSISTITPISNCSNSGTVNGTAYVGGIVGRSNSSKLEISNCSNSAAIIGTSDSVGGIIGSGRSGVVGCFNTGNITGTKSVGGISGFREQAGIISKCYNTGDIKGNTQVGGIEGHTYGVSTYKGYYIENCYNLGDVSGNNSSSQYVGGISGRVQQGVIANCYSYGTISNAKTGNIGTSLYYSGAIFGGSGNVTNSYYLNGTDGKATKKTADDFADGTVCKLLQAGTLAPTWGQTVGTDDYPVFYNGTNSFGSAITGISVSPESIIIAAEGTTTITAAVTPDDAIDRTVKWTTSNSAIATVEDTSSGPVASCVVTGIANGEVTITATTADGSFSDTCVVKVCDHKGSAHTEYTYSECTHTYTCTLCNLTTTEDCTFDVATGICTVCKNYAAVVSVTANGSTTHYKDLSLAVAYIKKLSGSDAVKMKLTADSTYASTVTFPAKTIELDLNGKTATVKTIAYTSGSDITVKDSTVEAAGKLAITSSHKVKAGAKLTLESGFVVGNYSCNYIEGTFVMTGGTLKSTSNAIQVENKNSEIIISGGTVDGGQYAIYRQASYHTSKITLSGGYFINGIRSTSSTGYPLSGLLAEGYRFVDDNNNDVDATVMYLQKNIKVVSEHTHSFTYIASGDTITAVCTADGCPLENADGGTLTISAPADLYVDGTTAKETTVENNLADTSVAVNVIYSTADGKAPTTAGTYTASITVGGATASVQFELVKRSAIAENFVYTAPENLVYDGTPKYATVEASPEITGMGEITVSYYQNGEAVEPINAGTYTVKVSTAETDKYYAINGVELGTFTINTKDISDGFIILGDALTYNGTEQTQTVEKVLATGTAPEVTFTVSGNTATNVGVYLLTVTGTGNFSGEAKIAYEIAVDASGIEGITPLNVKSSDKAKIEYVYNQLENAVTELADADKKAEWDNLKSDCVELLALISDTADEINRIVNAVNSYDIKTVTGDDVPALVQLADDTDLLLGTDNLTAGEREALVQTGKDIQRLISIYDTVSAQLGDIKERMNGYDEATVKYSDYKDILQIIDDIKALTDGQNITDDERASLEELNAKANALAAKIRSTADEIARITRAVNAYNIDTVKSSDKTAIENLIARIKKLTDGDNITDAEREQLVANDETLDALLAKINATADEIARIEESVNGYDAETVKSSDKADIEQLKADIKELTDGQNLTADEREYLVNADAECDKLLEKIADTKSEYDRVIALANGYDEATVTSADKDALVQLNDDIYALALTDNVTADELENLENAHDKVLGLIDKLTGISDEIKRIIEAVDKYVFESVKSSDKADIQQLIADIKALLDTQNITADERALLEGADETCTKLIEKIDETVAEISRINDATNAYDEATVTSADKADIEKLLADIKALSDGDNLTDTEREQLNGNNATLDALLAKINATADEIERIEEAVNSYDEATVKSTDKADLEKLIEDIKALTDGKNIADDERVKLAELDAKDDALIKKIDDTAAEIARIDEAVNSYDKETVTSDDVPELGKLIDDIKALTDGDNLTDDEKAALKENNAAIDELVEKLTEVAEEIKRVDEAVKSYDEETVKSSDKADLEQLKEDIQALIDITNTTENEKTALGEMIKKINALLDKISETEEKLEEIKGIENNYNPENITSDDKAAIEEKIAEIEALNPDNLTDEQKAEYEEIKAGFEALLEEIEKAGSEVEAIGAELEMFDENRVTIFWEDDIEALKAKIDELLADENMGEAEKAKLNEYKAQADNLIEIINDPCEYFSCRLFYFIWDCLTWKYNGILYFFKLIFAC